MTSFVIPPAISDRGNDAGCIYDGPLPTREPTNMKEELTGNRRFKRTYHWHEPVGLLLQVEVSVWNGTAWKCEWRDATPADLTPVEDIV